MFELILELPGELLLQMAGEILLELGLHAWAEPFRRTPNPWVAALGYTLIGALLGGLSLLAWPHNLVPEPWRLANLLLTPLVAGGAMAALGAWRARRGQPLLRIDRFSYGCLFAFSLAVVRYFFAT
jgi:hypothetical protein